MSDLTPPWQTGSAGADGAVDNPPSRKTLMATFWLAVAACIVLPRIPYGKNILYPFSLLGVWVHEMGHGLTAILTGGGFEKLILFKGLGGLAYHTGAGRFTGALVSAGGLLGPAVVGAIIIVLSARPKTSRWILPVLSVVIAISIVLFIRNAFGIVAMSLIAAVLIPIAFKAPDLVRIFVAQFIGVQFCLASWGSLDYMFTDEIVIDGERRPGDTGSIADALFLPYWFWGGLIALLSLLLLVWAFWTAWIKPFAPGREKPAAV